MLDPTLAAFEMTPRFAQALCDRRHGIGSDGILLGPLPVPGDPHAFGMRIFNPDGSEAEKSGDGLRIFARYLLGAGHAKDTGCRIHTVGGDAEVRFLAQDGSLVQVDMGKPSFRAEDIPFTGIAAHLEVLETPLFLPSGPITITALSLGNPHCVLFPGEVSPANARRLGAQIEKHPEFPERVNVQLVEVVDRRRIRIEIWERGARRLPRHRVHGGWPDPHDRAGPAGLQGHPAPGLEILSAGSWRPHHRRQGGYWTLSSSTSKIRSALGGMSPPAPLGP